MKFLSLIAFAFLIVTAPSRSFAADTCQSLKRVKSTVSLWLSVPEPVIDHKISREEINAGNEDVKKRWLEDNGLEMAISTDSMETLGLNTSGWKVGFNRSAITVRDFDRYAKPRTSCVYFKNLDVTLFLGSLISIPSEFNEGGCRYKNILEHEMRHYTTNEKIIRDARKKLEVELPKMLDEVEAESKPIVIKDENAEAQRLFGLIRDKIYKFLEENTREEMKKGHALIDTPEEYQSAGKMMKECGN